MKTKRAPKKLKPTFADRLITAIRKYSKMYPSKFIILNFKSLKLIGHSEMKPPWIYDFSRKIPHAANIAICEPIPPDTVRVCG